MKKQMSMTQILTKIKTTREKIRKLLESDAFNIHYKNGKYISYKLLSEMNTNDVLAEEKLCVSNTDSIISLLDVFKKLNIIKNSVNSRIGIMLSDGEYYRISELLALRSGDYNDLLTEFVKYGESQIIAVRNDMNNKYESLTSQDKLNSWINIIFGTTDKDSIDPDKLSKEIDNFYNRYKFSFINEKFISIIDKYKSLSESLGSELDYKLSEVNSRIIIECDLDESFDYAIINSDEEFANYNIKKY